MFANRLLCVLLGVVAGLLGCRPSTEASPVPAPAAREAPAPAAKGKAPEEKAASRVIDGAAAREKVRAGAFLLDVRTPEEFAEGHVDGAVNIPVQVLQERLAEVPRDREVVVYCRSGGRSARAAALLEEAGIRVHDLGAMSNWGAER